MTNLTTNDVVNIKKLYSCMETCWENHILDLAVKHYKDIKELEETYEIDIDEHFNIFTAIAEKYRYENLHSDLLKVIFGNEKNNIRNQNIFYNFLEYIGISKTEQKKYFPNYENIKFYREYPKGKKDAKDIKKYGFIDLLIYTEEACIIIENKINGAPDQPNQLGKYYARTKNEGKKFIKIVYLTIDDKQTEPSNFNAYEQEFKAYVPIIKKNLIHLPCVTEKNPNNKSFTEFLGRIIENKNIILDEKKKVFIEQYESLLKSIGGQVFMSKPETELIKCIMEDPVKIQAAKKFKEIWEHRIEIIGKCLVNDDMDKIDPQMEIAPDRTENDVCQKKIKDINYDVYLYYARNESNIEFGFRPPENTSWSNNDYKLTNKLKEAFKALYPNPIFDFKPEYGDFYPDENNIKWVYTQVFYLDNFKYEEICKGLQTCLQTLETKAHELLNTSNVRGKKKLQSKN